MRIPKQVGSVNLEKTIYLPNAPCKGAPYEGPNDFQALISRSINDLAFCSPVVRGGFAEI